MWKILTRQIREQIYYSLISRGIFSNEQKGYHKRTRGTGELLYIDQHIPNESKTRRKILAFAWIDNKKAFDMVLTSWILHCLKMYKIPDQIVQFIEKTMLTWSVELTTEGQSLAEVKIQRGIFQGDTLLPLLFVIPMPLNHILRKCTAAYKLIKMHEKINHLRYMDDIKLFAKSERGLKTSLQTVRIYSQDIGTEIGIEKYAMWVMKSDKRQITEGVKLTNQVVIRTLGEKETYKFLGILEADTIKQQDMKQKI